MYWQVENATYIELKPFGVISGLGRKTVKVGGFNIPHKLLIKLIASNKDATVERELIIHQETKTSDNGIDGKPKFDKNVFTSIALGILFFMFALFFYDSQKQKGISVPHNSKVNGSNMTEWSKTESLSTNNSKQIKSEKKHHTELSEKKIIVETKITNLSEEGLGSDKNLQLNEIDNEGENDIYTVVEQQPEFSGGMAALGQYLSKALHYPEAAQKANVSGRVFISFVVNTNGEIQDVKVLKGLGFGTDEEAARVVTNMPNWRPGKIAGRPVRVKYNLPINFTLE